MESYEVGAYLERVRTTALSMAHADGKGAWAVEEVLARARQYEAYLTGGSSIAGSGPQSSQSQPQVQ